MKKNIKILVAFLAIAVIISCSENDNSSYNPPPSNNNNTGESAPPNNNSSQSSSIPTSTQSSGSQSEGEKISIPYSSDSAPSDILDQIAWAGVGGGTLSQPCGNCLLKYSDIQGQIILSGFDPNQLLRILVYKSIKGSIWEDAMYLTEFNVKTDTSGKLIINIDGNLNDELFFFVLDGKSNKLKWRMVNASIANEPCPGAPQQRVSIGDKAYVCTASDSVRMRESPSINSNVILSLVPGADLKIIFGPECSDNWSWWQVETDSGKTGWIAEGGDNVDPYFICPK